MPGHCFFQECLWSFSTILSIETPFEPSVQVTIWYTKTLAFTRQICNAVCFQLLKRILYGGCRLSKTVFCLYSAWQTVCNWWLRNSSFWYIETLQMGLARLQKSSSVVKVASEPWVVIGVSGAVGTMLCSTVRRFQLMQKHFCSNAYYARTSYIAHDSSFIFCTKQCLFEADHYICYILCDALLLWHSNQNLLPFSLYDAYLRDCIGLLLAMSMDFWQHSVFRIVSSMFWQVQFVYFKVKVFCEEIQFFLVLWKNIYSVFSGLFSSIMNSNTYFSLVVLLKLFEVVWFKIEFQLATCFLWIVSMYMTSWDSR